MKAIIIAAGVAGRLGEETKNLPKALLKVNNKTILERQTTLLKKNKIDKIFVITGPHSYKFTNLNFTYIQDSNYTDHDILGSLLSAKQELFGDLIILYSDIIFDNSILSQVLNSTSDIGIAVDLSWEGAYEHRTEHPKSEAENVLIDKNKIIKIKKNILMSKKNELIGEFLGIVKLSAKGSEIILDSINKLEKNHTGSFHESPNLLRGYLTDLFQELIDLGIHVEPIIIQGKWCEIDTKQDLKKANNLFK